MVTFPIVMRLAVGSVMLAALLAAFPAVSLPAQGQQAASPDSLDPFLKKWLSEDIVYLISDAEKASYLGLKSDTERFEFIEQFWKQRDPSPGTPENEFRDEHYRRIAYANGRFPSTDPGWRTDRGRIYILLGPPDQIELHPAGRDTTTPFEIWRYRAGSGPNRETGRTFEFTGTEYKLRER